MSNNDKQREVLESLGMNKNEVKVYLSLLQLGSTTVSPIAKYSNIHRANVYDSLKKLSNKGLVTTITRGKSSFYEANDPEHLIQLLREKEDSLQQILPELKLKKDLSKNRTNAEIIEGVPAFVRLLNGLLSYGKEIFVFGIPSDAPVLMSKLLPRFHKKRISMNIKMSHIYNENAQERISFLNNMSFTEARFLPKQFNSNVTTVVCGSEVIIVSWEDPVSSLRIKSSSFAGAYRNYFALLWNNAKS